MSWPSIISLAQYHPPAPYRIMWYCDTYVLYMKLLRQRFVLRLALDWSISAPDIRNKHPPPKPPRVFVVHVSMDYLKRKRDSRCVNVSAMVMKSSVTMCCAIFSQEQVYSWGRSELTDRNVELYPQFFLEQITTQLRFYMVYTLWLTLKYYNIFTGYNLKANIARPTLSVKYM